MFDFSDDMSEGYSFYSTILCFGLNKQQIKILEDCIKNKRTMDKFVHREKSIRILVTDEITDIYAVPFFLAVINFKDIEAEDEKELFEFWKECSEPDLLEVGETVNNDQKFIIYALNSNQKSKNKLPQIHFPADLFNNIEKMKLDILSIIKDNEGVGRKACETSIRIYRVLSMYKSLLEEKILTKAMMDKLCYPDQISKRTFYRDIKVINEIEDDRLIFDKRLNGYILKK